MKYLILALIFLISCAPVAQEVTTKPTMETQPTAQPTQPILQPEVKVPQQTTIPETVEQPKEPVKQLSPEEKCLQACDENCDATAQNSCTQKGRPDCKAICGDNPTIDPSACTQACTYIPYQANSCKSMMSEFCSNQCVKTCH